MEKSYNDETKETIYSVFINIFLCFNKKAEKIPLYVTIKNEKYYIGINSQERFKKSKEMSGKHFYFWINEAGCLIINDNNSTNGTWLRLSFKPIELPENCNIRASYVIAQQLTYILFIHVIILSLRIARTIFLQMTKFVKFAKNNLKLYYHNLKLNDINLNK